MMNSHPKYVIMLWILNVKIVYIQKVCIQLLQYELDGWWGGKKLNLLLVKVSERDRINIRMASPSLYIYRRKKMRRDEEKSWSRKCILLTLQLSLSIYLSFFFLFVIYLSRNNFFLSKEIFRLSVKDLKQRLYLTALNTECLSWEDIPSEQQRIFLSI